MFPSKRRSISQIKARQAEIRNLLKQEDPASLDLDALENEIDELAELEKRHNLEQNVLNAPSGRVTTRFSNSGAPVYGDHDTTPDPTELRSFGIGDNLRSAVKPAEGPNLAAVVRGMATGDWSHVPVEQRALISSGASAAIPGASVLQIQEQAMAQSVVFQAGARGVGIDRPTEKVARIISTGAPEWKPDAADRDLTDQAITITPEDLTAHSAWLYTQCSIETLEDATGLEDAIVSAFSQQLAILYDQAAIAGSGTDMPLGVGAMTNADDGINELPLVGPLEDHKPFIQAAGLVLAKNHKPTSVMVDSDMWTDLAMLADTTGQPIQPPKAYTDLNEQVSNFLPEGTAIVADWTKWLFGTRTAIQLEVSRTGTGFKRGFVEIRAYVRFGGIPVDPTAFCLLSGMTAPVVS